VRFVLRVGLAVLAAGLLVGLVPMWDQGTFCGTALIHAPNSAGSYVALGPSGGAVRADRPAPCDSWHSTGTAIALILLGVGAVVSAGGFAAAGLGRRHDRAAP
jgi:hypothetical protein